jgi:LPXTG-motif cell wall-anchored protein
LEIVVKIGFTIVDNLCNVRYVGASRSHGLAAPAPRWAGSVSTGGGEHALPATGADTVPMILSGVAVLAVGAAAVFMARRRRSRFVLPK